MEEIRAEVAEMGKLIVEQLKETNRLLAIIAGTPYRQLDPHAIAIAKGR